MSEPTHFYLEDNNYFLVTQHDPKEVTTEIPPGIYRVFMNPAGRYLATMGTLQLDNLVDLPNTVGEKIISEIDIFFSEETRRAYERYGLKYRRGVLMHGKPGTGKSCTIYKVAEEAIKKGYIVLYNPTPRLVKCFVDWIRAIRGEDQGFLVVWEEFEDQVHDTWVLQLLDGAESLDNVLYIATTNYIDKIPPRIKNRPSRFASVIEVGTPGPDARRAYLEQKLDPEDLTGENAIDLDYWVELTDGMTIDHLKDLVISVQVFNVELEDAVTKLKSMSSLEL